MNHPKYHTDGASLDGWRIVIYLTVECALLHYNAAARLYGFEPVEHLDHYPNKFLTRFAPGMAIYCSDGQWCGLMGKEWADRILSPGAWLGEPDPSEKISGAARGASLGCVGVRHGVAGYGAKKSLDAIRKEKKS